MKSLQQNITVGHYEESEECETEEKSLNLMKINSEHPKPITTQAEDSCHQSTLLKTDKDVQSLHTNLSQCSSAYKEKVRCRTFSMFS